MTFEFSAGGIVLRPAQDKSTKNKREVLVCQHSQHHGWVFPKGLINDKGQEQTREETALREVEEETGVIGKIEKPLNPVFYWYLWEGEKKKKTVYYFLMSFVSEDTSVKDEEMEKVEWISEDEVEKRLTYKADKKAWAQARNLIK